MYVYNSATIYAHTFYWHVLLHYHHSFIFNSGITLLHKQICDAHYSETRCLPNKTNDWNRVKK